MADRGQSEGKATTAGGNVGPAGTGTPGPAGGAAPAAPAAAAPRRGPGHRGTDVRDAMAELAAKAQEISQEAGSKMASTMRDVIHAAAGMASFTVESARDLVQYMVRRGQISPEQGEQLLREAEEGSRRSGAASRPSTRPPEPKPLPRVAVAPEVRAPEPRATERAAPAKTPSPAPVAKSPAPRKSAAKPAAKPASKSSDKGVGRAAAKKAPAKGAKTAKSSSRSNAPKAKARPAKGAAKRK